MKEFAGMVAKPDTSCTVQLLIVHFHLRPGGVRRVIELATPHLVAHAPERITGIVLATGEAPDTAWLESFRLRLPGTPVTLFVEPAFGYASELGMPGERLRRRVREGLRELIRQTYQDEFLIWAHNLGLGRNLYLARELSRRSGFGHPLMMHHHDWWFDNRWHHFTAMQEPGFRKLNALADAVFGNSPTTAHLSVNQADATVLKQNFPTLAGWLPNPVAREAPPTAARVQAARQWLSAGLGEAAPVWLVPCRMLRRKNFAEALLLARWLRPEAWLVTTGSVSSAEEQQYADTLAAAANQHGWRLRLGILSGDETQKPAVPELMAASEAVLLTSVQEGFGLPYLEAAAAGRPLLARKLPNIAPDLAKFGFAFPQSYGELLVDPRLFDWPAERARQRQRFAEWKGLMPRTARRLVGQPALLAAAAAGPVPFSRLTLTAQIEVLGRPVEESWTRCAPFNPFLRIWRTRAAAGQLQVSAWPATAARWLGGRAYARSFFDLVPDFDAKPPRACAAQAAQADFLRQKLCAANLYPLLWNSQP